MLHWGIKQTLVVVGAVVVVGALGAWWYFGVPHTAQPARVVDTGNAAQKADLIVLDTPQPNQAIASPLTLAGRARGSWFFEATFPVVLLDAAGNTVAQGHATAQSDWMTTELVPFKVEVTVTMSYSGPARLAPLKDNPSGLPEHDDSLEIPIVIQ